MNKKAIVPLNGRILISKDEDIKKTPGGLMLPDSAKIPVITGRVVGIAKDVEQELNYQGLNELDRVIIDPHGAIPASFEPNNKLFILPKENIIAILNNSTEENHGHAELERTG